MATGADVRDILELGGVESENTGTINKKDIINSDKVNLRCPEGLLWDFWALAGLARRVWVEYWEKRWNKACTFLVTCAVASGVGFKLELCKWCPAELGQAPGHSQLSLKSSFCDVCCYLAPKRMEII